MPELPQGFDSLLNDVEIAKLPHIREVFDILAAAGITFDVLQQLEVAYDATDFFKQKFFPIWASDEFFSSRDDMPEGIYFTNLSLEEIRDLVRNLLEPIGTDQSEVAYSRRLAREKVEAVQPPVELKDPKYDDLPWLRTLNEVNQAKLDGRLIDMGITHIKFTEGKFSIPEIKQLITNFSNQLWQLGLAVADVPEVGLSATLKMTSAERSAGLQALLVKLGYPAAIRSYHNLGRAVDLSIPDPFYNKVVLPALGYYEEKDGIYTYQGESDVLAKINEVYVNADPEEPFLLTMRNLVDSGYLAADNILVQIFNLLTEVAAQQGVTIYDETAFFSILPEAGHDQNGNIVKVTNLNLVWHLQVGL